MSQRACGDCTLCCKLLRVAELNKPVGRLCTHCRPGEGCGIYEERPPSCRNFQCFWLMNEAFPDDLRPDRSHALVAFNDTPDSVVIHVDPKHPRALDRRPAADLIPALLKVYERVFIVCGGEKAMIRR
jgi:uncharacterized protein